MNVVTINIKHIQYALMHAEKHIYNTIQNIIDLFFKKKLTHLSQFY